MGHLARLAARQLVSLLVTRYLGDCACEARQALIELLAPIMELAVIRTVLATMLAEAPDALQRRDYHALRTLCGSAPVTRRSGKSRFVMRRRACNRRLSNACRAQNIDPEAHAAC
jgi:hypothetical protein